MTASDKQMAAHAAFEITRVFNAPRERVWRAWSEIAQLQR